MTNFLKAIALASALAFSVNAQAQEGKLEIKTVVQKEEQVTDASGKTTVQLVPVESVVPGEEVIYTVSYTNISSEKTDNIVITNPIPAQLTYVQGSAFGPGTQITFSVDGGKTFGSPETLLVSDNGLQRSATPEDFTNIRWQVTGELNSGDRGFARFRARLN